MTNDWMLGSLYLLMAIMLVARLADQPARTVRPAGDDGAGLDRHFRRRLHPVHASATILAMSPSGCKAEATGAPVVEGQEVRIPMAIDGHFWVEASLNGVPVKFLVDSGATMTTIGRDTAATAGVDGQRQPQSGGPHRQRHAARGVRPGRQPVGRADRARPMSGCTSPTMRI